MHKAWQAGDSEALLDRTHWMKGSAGTPGFDVFIEPAEGLQSCPTAGERDRAHQILEQLCVLVSRVQKGMDAADEQSELVATRANGA